MLLIAHYPLPRHYPRYPTKDQYAAYCGAEIAADLAEQGAAFVAISSGSDTVYSFRPHHTSVPVSDYGRGS